VQYRVGEGGLFVTTFRFHNYGRDAYATALLDAIVRYVASDEFAPTLQLTRVADHEQAR
jgi:hypothetical protein